MLDRRSFFRWSLVTGLGLHGDAPAGAADKPSSEPPPYSPNEFERIVAMCNSLDVLGRPRSWSLVRDGFHPISPERVIVMSEKGGDGWSSRECHLEDCLREYLSESFELKSWCGLPMGTYHVPTGKLDLIFRLMQEMTDYYRVPHLFPIWAINLAKREALASTGTGQGFGLLHQFQDDGIVQLTNTPVDWWLALFPGGVEWGAWDGKPVFAMIGHIFPSHHRELPGLKLRAWQLTSCVGRRMDTDSWARIAELDRMNAAQTVNLAILLALQAACEPEGERQ
jgi:hypothetical protein